MAIKVYGVFGRTTALLRIPTSSSKAYLEIEFKRGRLGLGRNNQAATYSTDDKTEQEIIENSPYFTRTIKLLRVYRTEDEMATPSTKNRVEAENDLLPVPEVTTAEEAAAYLKSKGAKATNLRDTESMKRFAAKIGVTFPNLTL